VVAVCELKTEREDSQFECKLVTCGLDNAITIYDIKSHAVKLKQKVEGEANKNRLCAMLSFKSSTRTVTKTQYEY